MSTGSSGIRESPSSPWTDDFGLAIRVEAIGIGVASVSTHGGLSMETANFHSHEQRKAPFVPFEAGACAMDLCRYPASSLSTQVYPMYVI